MQTLNGHVGAVYFARFSASGSYSLTGGASRQIHLFNPHSGLLIRTYCGHGYEVLSATWAKDSSCFVSVGGDRSGFVFDVNSGIVRRKLDGHTARVNDVELVNESNVLCVTGSFDGDVRVWDLRQRGRCCVQVMGEAEDSVSSIAWSKEWGIVASSVDGFVRQYDIRRGELRKDWIGTSIGCVRVSSDHECGLVGSLDSKLRLLSLGGGELLAEYKGGLNMEFQLECGFTASDRLVVSGSEKGEVLFWDLVKGGSEPLATIKKAHEGPVSAIGVSCGKLLTGGHDGKAYLWQ